MWISKFQNARSLATIAAGLVLVVATACNETPEGVGANNLGGVDVTVVDQTGAGVPFAEVIIQEKSGSTIVQKQSSQATSDGITHFGAVQLATLQAWAESPVGYSGGGETNAVTFRIVPGQNVDVKITLVKNP